MSCLDENMWYWVRFACFGFGIFWDTPLLYSGGIQVEFQYYNKPFPENASSKP